jgi:hypothetical protein
MKLIVVFTAQRDREVVPVLECRRSQMTFGSEVVCITYGVLTNATAMAANHGHVLFASKSL